DIQPKPPQPHWFKHYMQPCVAELLGTALFVSCLSVVEQLDGTGRLWPALPHRLALAFINVVLG
ncbi:AQP8 protein, partial [Rhinopomastus cyanomelas]|nr:AQP8 protein [Rhinopomastus cyanomelas]